MFVGDSGGRFHCEDGRASKLRRAGGVIYKIVENGEKKKPKKTKKNPIKKFELVSSPWE
jgi:hypothetical protein